MVLGQGLANPVILPLVGAYYDDETISGGVVGMQEICHDTQQAKPTSEYDELIFGAYLRAAPVSSQDLVGQFQSGERWGSETCLVEDLALKCLQTISRGHRRNSKASIRVAMTT